MAVKFQKRVDVGVETVLVGINNDCRRLGIQLNHNAGQVTVNHTHQNPDDYDTRRAYMSWGGHPVPTLVFDSAANTVTRDEGSWIDDGFVDTMDITFTSPLNKFTAAAADVTSVAEKIITLNAGQVQADETVFQAFAEGVDSIANPAANWVASQGSPFTADGDLMLDQAVTALQIISTGAGNVLFVTGDD